MSRRPTSLLALWVVAALAACSTREPPEAVDAARVERFALDDLELVLGRFVDDRGRVDYAGLRRDRAALDRFVSLIAAVGPSTRPDLFPDEAHELAYWIDAYNALVLREVLERPDLVSVHDERVDFFALTRNVVDGEAISLHSLENDVIRERFDEPRVHFALNCASLGCPRLPQEPFRGDVLDEQLARATDEFLREPRNVSVEAGRVVLSELFDWYGEDFPPDPLSWIRRHTPALDLPGQAKVDFREWDWSLNDR